MINMPGESYDEFFKHIVGRSETQLLNDDQIQNFFSNERILVIGAGGSIGSALARRLISAKIKNVFFLTSQDSYDNITEINDSIKKILKIFKEGNIKP